MTTSPGGSGSTASTRAVSSWSSTGGRRSPRASTRLASTTPAGWPGDQLRRPHRRPVRGGLRHRPGLGLVAADGGAVAQPRRGHARRGGHAAIRPGSAGAPRSLGPDGAARRTGDGQDGGGPASRRLAGLQRSAHHRRSHPGHRARATASCASWPRCCPPWARPASPRPPSSACWGRVATPVATSDGSACSIASRPVSTSRLSCGSGRGGSPPTRSRPWSNDWPGATCRGGTVDTSSWRPWPAPTTWPPRPSAPPPSRCGLA